MGQEWVVWRPGTPTEEWELVHTVPLPALMLALIESVAYWSGWWAGRLARYAWDFASSLISVPPSYR